MSDCPDIHLGDLPGIDLDRAHESLYYAARRYCAITEKAFLQSASRICPDHDREFVSIGDAAADLTEAGRRYSDAYVRWETCLPPDDEIDDEPA